MKKKVVFGTIIGGVILVLACIAVSNFIFCNETYDYERFRNPSSMASYDPDAGYFDVETGYYKIDPETILTALEQDEIDVFTPLLESSEWPDELSGVIISWTQADFLKISSALGRQTWGDPMDLEEWKVYRIFLQGSCEENSIGFHSASITYYKTIDINGKKLYTTRLIRIDPYGSVIDWGSGATYPQTRNHWDGVDLVGAKISADAALRIAEENGGKETRLQDNNNCLFYISSSTDSNNKWELSYITAATTPGIEMSIDLYSGEYEIINDDH